MFWPSKTLVLSAIFIAYISHSIYNIVDLFIPPKCKDPVCLNSFLSTKPKLQLLLCATTVPRLEYFRQLELIDTWSELNYDEVTIRNVTVPIPRSTRQNGSLYLHAFVTEVPRTKSEDWTRALQQQTTMSASIPLTLHLVPEAETFNLLNDDKSKPAAEEKVSKDSAQLKKPITHMTKNLRLTMLTDLHSFPTRELPQDLFHLLRIIRSDLYLPPVKFDRFSNRLRDFYKVNKTEREVTLELEFSSESIGKIRLGAQIEGAMDTMRVFGFSDKDLDEVKAIFADTNMYLLGLTMFVASVHLLFDFLAFKNDIRYWKHRKTTVGLSTRTILWRCFSQIVIFLYLLEEKSSLLIIIPGGIGVLIEIWKVTKAFKIKVEFSRGLPRLHFGTFTDSEKATAEHDVESMRYLSYLFYPLITGGAIYSLLYTPHKSWYQWALQSTVNGVYAFGFLFMLPQLFVNYRLKSVAHLPWRAFMYKAFNTFIDDLFAFIITMPTAHRLACFRDDIVFLIYLYQRWLYPVDKKRLDAGGEFEMELDDEEPTAPSAAVTPAAVAKAKALKKKN